MKSQKKDEVIFCGYGEPMLKLDILKTVAEYIKTKYPQTKIRINTNGHANYVYKRNVVPELKGLVDEFSVSLNGENTQEYNELSQPKFEGAYDEVKKFIKECSNSNISVVTSVVEGYKGRHLNLKSCEKISTDLGAKFRVREWIVNGY
jgi:TatD DNase family protein